MADNGSGRGTRHFWLARQSDGHRFDGSQISARDASDAEQQYRELGWFPRPDLVVVNSAQQAA